MFIKNNFGFCSLCIWRVSSTNIFRRMQIEEKKLKTKNYIDMELKWKSDSDGDSDSDIYIEE